ncbi:MAG: hypothetical protein AB1588_07840 [Pseudomonadota bacterium]
MKNTKNPTGSFVAALISEVKGREDWLQILCGHRYTATLPNSTGKAQQELAKTIQDELLRGRVGTALAAARIGVFLDPVLFLREARRTGSFRASKYKFQSGPLIQIACALLSDAALLKIDERDCHYLQSVINFLSLGSDASKLRVELLKELRKHKRTAIKSCMVLVDRRFRPAASDFQTEADVLAEHNGNPEYFSREKQAEALSLLTTMMHEVVGLNESMTILVDEHAIRDGLCEQMLLAANRLNELREAEILLDCFPYHAEKAPGGIRISAIEDRFEQSVRLGYIQADMQKHVRHMTEQRDADVIQSLHDHAKEFYRHLGPYLVKRNREPLDRYVLKIPLVPSFTDLINDPRLFREELGYLLGMAIDAFNEMEWLETKEVAPNITVRDLMKAQRIFTFLSTVFFEALDQPDPEGNALDMRSRLPVFPVLSIRQTLSVFFSEEQAKRILELLSFDPRSGGYFDLQYTPLLCFGSNYLLPMGVLTCSDLVRGVLYRLSNRLLPDDGSDPMQGSLAKALASQGFNVACGVKRVVDGRDLEVDILAMLDGHLMVFECKNSFHPCSPQEMRTNYDHILKGGKQLSRALAWITTPGVQESLFKTLRWPAQKTTSVKSCIVTANRIFNGYSVNGHPVRQAHEMQNFLNEGRLRLSSGVFRLWRTEKFSVNDFNEYLSNSSYLEEIFNCMQETISTHPLGGKLNLQFKTFSLDMQALERAVHNRFLKTN